MKKYFTILTAILACQSISASNNSATDETTHTTPPTNHTMPVRNETGDVISAITQAIAQHLLQTTLQQPTLYTDTTIQNLRQIRQLFGFASMSVVGNSQGETYVTFYPPNPTYQSIHLNFATFSALADGGIPLGSLLTPNPFPSLTPEMIQMLANVAGTSGFRRLEYQQYGNGIVCVSFIPLSFQYFIRIRSNLTYN